MNRKEAKMKDVTVMEGLTVKVMPYERHEFLMTTKQVARGYGVSEYNVRQHKLTHPAELIEGKHFVTAVSIPNGDLPSALKTAHNAVLWTKRGIVRLGFFIKSERARMFRDWAEELIITIDERRDLFGEEIPAVSQNGGKRRNHNRLTRERLIGILSDVAKIDDKAIRLSLVEKLTHFNN